MLCLQVQTVFATADLAWAQPKCAKRASYHYIYSYLQHACPARPGCVSKVCILPACMGTAVMLSAFESLADLLFKR